MIEAVNAILNCLVTGLFGALFIVLFARLGWLPIAVSMSVEDFEETFSEEFDEDELDK
ncbi:hypothetical protein APT65_00040 [Trabzonvirus APT65]|uniref:Uncharacterized protein n=1 Tax=Aeromonas phage APT65 TaxID=2982914 RepID=A0A9E8GHS6_9CAUD|nr:hypothetical protein APT65_00040 [Aeromonas phage APT65]